MARSLNGTSGTITVTRQSILEPPFPITLSCWFKGSSQGNFKYLVSKLAVTGDHSAYAFGTGAGGTARFYIGTGAATLVAANNGGATNPFNGAWHHWLGTYDGTTVTFYLDGVSAGTASTTAAIDYGTAGVPNLYFGSFDNTQLYFAGSVADIALWDVVLTADERAALAKGVSAGQVRPNELRGYWPLYGVAGPEPDLSGNINNGALTGTALADHAPVGPYVPYVAFPEPIASASGPASVSLTPAVVSLAGQPVTPTPKVTLSPAVVNLGAQPVTPTPKVTLTPATLATAAPPVSPSAQPVIVNLTPATVATSAIPVTPTPKVTLTAAVLSTAAQALSPAAQPATVNLTPAVLTLAGQPLGISGSGFVNLTPAVVQLGAQPVTPTPTVALSPATLATSAVPVTPTPVVTLSPAALGLAARPLALTATVNLAAAQLTLAGVPLSSQSVPAVTLAPAVLTLAGVRFGLPTHFPDVPRPTGPVVDRPTGDLVLRPDGPIVLQPQS